MVYPNFNDIDITTMVVMCYLSYEIILPQVFCLFPISPDILSLPRKYSGKVEQLPHHNVPGSMIHLRYRGNIRGFILKNKPKKDFKNTIMVDISIKEKNINIRLSPNTAHICGLKSLDQITETYHYIEKYVKEINDESTFASEHPDAKAEAMKYIRDNIRTIIIPGGNRLSISHPDNFKTESTLSLDAIRIVNFFTRNIWEHSNSSFFIEELEWLINQGCCFLGNICPMRFGYIMVNKNYNLGFLIDRHALAKYLFNYKNFVTYYDPAANIYVKVNIPFYITEGSNIHRKTKKKPKKDENGNIIPEEHYHRFMVYKTGSVTQTGPNLELTEIAYKEFRDAIELFRDKIEREALDHEEPVEIVGVNISDDIPEYTDVNTEDSYSQN